MILPPDQTDLLEPEEVVVATLAGDGATLVATDRRVLIVRQGAGFRPRSGIRSWSYDAIHRVSLSRPRSGQAVVSLRMGPYPWQAVSMFFEAQNGADAARAIAEIRRRIVEGLRPGR